MALNSLYCADVPLSNYSLTHYYSSMQTELATILVAKLLLEHSSDVNQPTARGSSPLSRLTECTGHVESSDTRSVVDEG